MSDVADDQARRSRLELSRSCTDNGVETLSTCPSSQRPSSPERRSSSESLVQLGIEILLTSSYTLICTSTDFDAWRTGHAPVTVEEVVKTLHTNAGNARAVAAGILQDVHDVVAEGKELNEVKGCMQFACITRKDVSIASSLRIILLILHQVQPEEARKKLSFILPYFK